MQSETWRIEQDNDVMVVIDYNVRKSQRCALYGSWHIYGFYSDFEKAKRAGRKIAYLKKGERAIWTKD